MDRTSSSSSFLYPHSSPSPVRTSRMSPGNPLARGRALSGMRDSSPYYEEFLPPRPDKTLPRSGSTASFFPIEPRSDTPPIHFRSTLFKTEAFIQSVFALFNIYAKDGGASKGSFPKLKENCNKHKAILTEFMSMRLEPELMVKIISLNSRAIEILEILENTIIIEHYCR